MTRILFFYPATYLAPSWTICAQIGRHLDSSRYAKFAAMDEAAVGDLGVGPEHGVTVERFSLGTALAAAKRGKPASVAKLAVNLAKVAAFIRKNRIDVVHASDDGTSMSMALALAKATGARLLLHYHTIPSMYSGARLEFTRVLGKLADYNVGCSRFVARDAIAVGIPASKTGFVLNGTDPERFHPRVSGARLRAEYGIAEGEVLALQLARIWQPKRQEDFVRGLAIARRKQPKLRGLIVGWEDPRYVGAFGSYKEELLHIAKTEGLGDGVIIGKARPEATELHAAADIAVLPSVGEPFGLVVVEAMATERAVIGAESGGIPEIIDDGKDGLLVPPRSPEAIAEKLVLLAGDAALRKRLGKAAREKVLARYTERHVAEHFGPIYDAVAQRAAAPEYATP